MKETTKLAATYQKSNAYYIGKGIMISVLCTVIGLTIFAAILTYTKISEKTVYPVIIILSALSILMGSSLSTIKIKKNGLLNGFVIGFVYVSVLYLISSITKTGFTMNMYTLIMIIASIVTGMIGGVVGVNIR